MAAGSSKGGSAASTPGVVVWEWEKDNSLWVSHDSYTSSALEEAYRNGKSNLELGKVTPELALYKVDLKQMRQSRTDTGSTRRLRRTTFTAGTPQADGVEWKWQEKGQWLCYDNHSSICLEEHYLRQSPSVHMSKIRPNMPYYIDLRRMEQCNIHTGYKRKIQRVPLRWPYPPASEKDLADVHSALGAVKLKAPNQRKRKNQSRDAALGICCQTPALVAGSLQWLAHCKVVSKLDKESEKEDCAICFEKLSMPSDYATKGSESDASTVIELKKCKHMFHKLCLQALYETSSKSGFIQCPRCKVIHGVKIGNQPKDGSMVVTKKSFHLPGYPKCGTIVIRYSFYGGIQGPEHPEPGKPYSAHGFPRTCYLPDNKDGNKVRHVFWVGGVSMCAFCTCGRF